MLHLIWDLRRLRSSCTCKRAETPRDHYPMWIGLIYIYNLIVATGALSLPASFAKAGWLLSTISLFFLAFVSFLTATFIVETMSCVNAVNNWKGLRHKRDRIRTHPTDSEDELPFKKSYFRHADDEDDNLACSMSIPTQYYNLDSKVEIGEMAEMFFSRSGVILFYVTLLVFLYGDMAIYAATVAKSIMDLVCTNIPANTTTSNAQALPCFTNSSILPGTYTRLQFYRMTLLTFFSTIGPLVFFNIQKTKYLQMFTIGLRWMAFGIMILKAIHMLITTGPQGKIPAYDFKGLPIIFGACVYSYMCHPFLPSVISPIRDKTNLCIFIGLTYGVISLFYLLLAYTGAFAFARLNDIHTLNFIRRDNVSFIWTAIGYFLALFPVFTLSTTFPIIAITLRDNLLLQFYKLTRKIRETYRFVFFSLMAILPPLVLPYFLNEHGYTILIKITGSFAGTAVQYLIPTFLVMCARRHCKKLFGSGIKNRYQSPFSHIIWVIFVLVWSVMCIIIVFAKMYYG